MTGGATALEVLHELPGRVRIRLPGTASRESLKRRLRQVPGVRRVRANHVTGSVLVEYEPPKASREAVFHAVREAAAEPVGAAEPERPPAVEDRAAGLCRARIAVRGIDRDPALARRVLERLEQFPGVRARASQLTGRVLVTYDPDTVDLEELCDEVAALEAPALPGEERPPHPLDLGPLLQSAVRTAGAVAGLGLIALRRARRQGSPANARAFATTASIVTLLQAFPAVRYGLRHLFGETAAELAMGVTSITANALAGSPLSLCVSAAESLRLLTEVRARRGAWYRHEERASAAHPTGPGRTVRLEAGDRVPLRACVVEGVGTAVARDGLPVGLRPGAEAPAGARLAGGPFVLQLVGGQPFAPRPRPAMVPDTVLSRYLWLFQPVVLGYVGVTAAMTRSLARSFIAALLVNPRTAVTGADTANLDAAARVLRGGVTVVGTRRNRVIRKPSLLLLDGVRLLADGLEVSRVLPSGKELDGPEILSLAGAISAACGSPWGRTFPESAQDAAADCQFDGRRASATVGGRRYTLESADPSEVPPPVRARHRGDCLLALRDGGGAALGLIALRPRLAAGVGGLVDACKRHGVRLALLCDGCEESARALARRVGVSDFRAGPAAEVIRTAQLAGELVAFLTDSPDAAEAFEAADLALALTARRTCDFAARADLLLPDLEAVGAILAAGAAREAAVRDAVLLSLAVSVGGAVWGIYGRPGVRHASDPMHIATLLAVADGWLRTRGGERPASSRGHLTDSRPERWGRRSVESVFRAFHSRPAGLTRAEAARRRKSSPPVERGGELLAAVLNQLRYPTTTILAAGAGASLFMGDVLDAGIIGATVAVNVVVGAWQEYQADRTAEALESMSTATARVLRDGVVATVAGPGIVPGDVLVLAPGDRVAADARLVDAHALEVDEAALTGESMPVPKTAEGGTDESRVVLEGSDVLVGSGHAVVVAVGRQTRMGATALALTADEERTSPLGVRLGRLLYMSLPLAVAGGAVTVLAGLVRRRPLGSQLAVGASLALAVVPEGLPLLAGVGAASVARRLAGRRAVVRRPSVVEALGRVDVVCTDKTGTLTEGRLALGLVADQSREARLPGALPADLRRVLLAAALASPHPDAADATAHPTDVAVVRGARVQGLGKAMQVPREAEAPFDPARAFHAAVVAGRLYAKGSPEELLPRCSESDRRRLDDAGRRALAARARHFADQGLRVLLVAEGPADTPIEDPHGLSVLGFVGIRDPIRRTVRNAVRRCREAGVRVVMLTGDHPATAQSIARDAGLGDGEVLTGAELEELEDGELDARLQRAAVVARATPLDKLRIVECLQKLGHTVAMTGDGVNDAPSLRLADVGVAMGRAGTEVARQAADVVLGDDDFATLVETFVEGRGFWQNMRRAVGLLLGGNLGELGLIAGAHVLGMPSPLNARQILVVNLITDALPALSVVLQSPEHRHLAGLAREGTAALDETLRREVWRRGVVTAAPALAAYMLARRWGDPARASSVAYTSIVANQLAQTIGAGRVEGRLSPSVLAAVGGSGAFLLATLALPPLAKVLGLAMPSAVGWALIDGAAMATVFLDRIWPAQNGTPLATAAGGSVAGEAPQPVGV